MIRTDALRPALFLLSLLLCVLTVYGLSAADTPVAPPVFPAETTLSFTAEEQRYLRRKGEITMCVDPAWMPYEQINDDGEYEGLGADFYALFEARIGVPITLYPTTSWNHTLQSAYNRKCDIISMAKETEERKVHMDFTEPFVSYPFGIATTHDKLFIYDLGEELDKTFAVVKGYAVNNYLRSTYPDIKIVEVASSREGLRKVRDKKVFGYIDSIFAIGYVLSQGAWLDIKIAGELDWRSTPAIATRNDEPLLRSIMQKAIQSVSDVERQAIYDRWITIRFERRIDYGLVWRILGGVALIIFLGVWRYREIQAKNRLIEERNAELTEAHEKISDTLHQIATLLDHSGEGVLSFGENLRVDPRYSLECESIFGGPIADEHLPELLYPHTPEKRAAFTESLRALFARPAHPDAPSPPRELSLNERCFSVKFETLSARKIMLVLHDITSEKAYWRSKEEILIQQSRMANLGELVGAITHQWRQPLSEIASNLMRIQVEHTYKPEPDIQAIHAAVETNNQLLTVMSRTLDTFKSIYTLDTRTEHFSLPQTIDDTITIFQSIVQHVAISLDYDTTRQRIYRLEGSREDIVNIFLILFKNSYDAFSEHAIKERKITIALTRRNDADKNTLEVVYTDNAGGIRIDPIDTIFEPNISTKPKEGMGIGLYIARKLLTERYAGGIRAENTPEGARFIMRFSTTAPGA